jgi:hypothetical protein
MAELLERVKLSLLVNGNGITENFINNSKYFAQTYTSSSEEVKNIPVSQIKFGYFYHLAYRDPSNWMQYSPILAVEFKKFSNMIILIAVNLNFIPLEVRTTIFDSFMKEDHFDKNIPLSVSYTGVYNELSKYGFEYSLVEYNVAQIHSVHQIDMSIVPRFLYAGHPKTFTTFIDTKSVKYNPEALYKLYVTKLASKDQRDQEMKASLISDFYNASDDILQNYKALKNHIERLQKSAEKYG